MRLHELFRFAIEYTESKNASNIAAYNELDENRKNFITCVPNILSKDEMRVFEESMKALEDPEATFNEKDTAFSEIKEQMENGRFTKHFAKVNGTTLIVAYVNHENVELKKHAMECVTYMADNDDSCTECLVQENIMPLIIENLKSRDFEVVETALRTTTALTFCNEAYIWFVDAEGIKALLQIFNTGHRCLSYQSCCQLDILASKSKVLRDLIVIKLDPNRIVYHFETTRGGVFDLDVLLNFVSTLTKSKLWKPGDEVNAKIIEIVQEIWDLYSSLPGSDTALESSESIIQNLVA